MTQLAPVPRRSRMRPQVARPSGDLRAQYLAASYLVSASEQALEHMRTLAAATGERSPTPAAACALVEAIHADWAAALRDVAQRIARGG